MKPFAAIIEEIKQLSHEEKKELLYITKQQLIEEERNRIYKEHQESMNELKKDKLDFSDDVDQLKHHLKDL
jgi:hypothetical protein